MNQFIGSRWVTVGVFLACLVVAWSSDAQDHTGKNIREVRIEGLTRVSEEVARGRIESRGDTAYDANVVARDVRRLYEAGLFESVNVEVREAEADVILVFTVTEKRLIEDVRIIGNRRIRARNIRGVLTMREGGAFVPELFEEERKAILDLYAEKGFANTTVDVVAENVGPSAVRLVYTIGEGRKARIRSIRFVGNEALSRRDIRDVMQTRAAWWFIGGRFEEDRFEADLQSIVDEYGNHGRLEARVKATDKTFSEDGRRMDITIYLEEGPQYTVDAMDIDRNVVFADDEIMEMVGVHPGEVHDAGQVTEDAQLIQQGYQDSGYVDAQVTPQVTLDHDAKTTRVVYQITEGDLKYVREIRITGNNVTQDEIIRRQMLLIPGERYDGTAVADSERRLMNTRFFDNVRINLDDTDDELFTDVLVDVEEGRTGIFNFGAGYSSEDRLGVFSEVRLNNFDAFNWPTFTGGGQQLRLRVHTGERRNEYNISFTEPEFLGYPLSFGFDLFDESYRVRGAARYREEARGGQLRIGKSLSPYVFAQTTLRYQETELSELPFLMNRELRRQADRSTIIANRWQIERNTLDSTMDPSRGGLHVVAAEVAGLGGDHEFLRFEHDSSWYRSIGAAEKLVLSLRMRHGVMAEYGDSEYIPLQERFYAGGTATVRGYRNRDIGPKVREYLFWGDWFAVGGNARVVYNLEAKYRVSDIFRVYLFTDAGGVFHDVGDFDVGDINYSAGLGMGFNVPMFGPIRVDYAYPLNPKRHQSSSARFHLSTGFRF